MARDMIPTVDQRRQLFQDSVYYEIIHTFGIPAGVTDDQLNNHAIGETINFSRHVHARALAHFLYRRPSDSDVQKRDDAFAEDFGFDPTTLGSDEVRKRKTEHKDLNKGLIHITYGRVTGATTKPWSSPVLKDLLPVTIQFMKHIRDNERVVLAGGGDLFANEQERKGWQELLACLQSCQKRQRLRFKSGFDGQKTWYVPQTEPGDIADLYGTKGGPAPAEAVVLGTATNTADPRFLSFP